MALMHYVNGELVEMTTEEEAAFEASRATRRTIPKSTVWARLVALGKADEAKTALDANAVAWGRWFSPDWPNVFADDDGLLAFLDALDLSEEQIATVTA
jgi:hypothetical protein